MFGKGIFLISRRWHFLVMVSLLLAGLFAGCMRLPRYVPPPATIILDAAPLEADARVLYEEWLVDSGAVLARYRDVTLYFRRIFVEQVAKAEEMTQSFVINGQTKFVVADVSDLEQVSAGQTVDIVGRLSGIFDDKLIISDCWVRIVDTRKPAGY